MKTFCLLITALISIMVCNSALAEENLPWQGAQLSLFAAGQTPVLKNGETETVGLRGQLTLFNVPSLDSTTAYVYAGPYFNPTSWLWFSPQGGMISTVAPDGEDVPLASLWANAYLCDCLNIFAEGDAYFNHDRKTDWYSYLAIDILPSKSFNLGLQAEGLNDAFIYGPHLGLTKAQFKFELQYYASFQTKNRGQTARLVVGANY